MAVPIKKKRDRAGVLDTVLAQAKEQEELARQQAEEKKKQLLDGENISSMEEEVPAQKSKRGRKPSGKDNTGKQPVQTFVEKEIMIQLMILKVKMNKPICEIVHDAVVEYIKEHGVG